MKPYRTLAAAAVALALGAAAPAFAADAHSLAEAAPAVVSDAHSHAAGAPVKLALDHGRKWTTDAPLRQRMGEIRALMATELGPIHAGKLSPERYRQLGAAVEEKVAAIVAECKLPPEADAMLHLVVADLVAGADIMQGKAHGTPAEGAHKIVTAANAYGRYFDHAGWKPLG
jgi:hypothetical protein